MKDQAEHVMDRIGCSAIGYQDVDVCIPEIGRAHV